MINVGQKINRTEFLKHLVGMHYTRTNVDLSPGEFRALGGNIEIMPISEKKIYRLEVDNNVISFIQVIDPVSSIVFETPNEVFLYPAKHFITNENSRDRAIKSIKIELEERLKELETEGRMLEAERLKRRTNYDLAMIREVGYCSGIENYSRHLSGKAAGEPPETLLSYFPHDKKGNPEFLTVIDESHVTLPQVRGMYAGDQSRKATLVEYGFRLPSAKDNRPLRYPEFEERVGQVLYVSATPSDYEKEESAQIVQQIIRPTGLVDPVLIVRPVVAGGKAKTFSKGKSSPDTSHGEVYRGQVQDFISEAKKEIKNSGRVLATTLTKKMAEDLSVYLKEENIKAEYIHSDVKTIERIDIITKFRKGEFDILVGVNLLREGLDMPEVTLIGILDADKEGFLRSDTSLIQTIGRAARNVDGRVILYADKVTGSMERAMGETNRRREIQLAYNKKHDITPKTIKKTIHSITEHLFTEHEKMVNLELGVFLERIQKLPESKQGSEYKKLIKQKEREMSKSVEELDFESAAILRDEIKILYEISGVE